MTDRKLAGRYELTRLIGEGSIAQVYAATDLQLGRSVAVKLLRTALATDQAIVDRFLEDAQLSAGLAHPNIVPIFDIGHDNGQPFVVMELVDGGSLERYIDEQAPFELNDVITVARQVADALEFAHASGVVHRGLKPQNVLITQQGLVKLTDFGAGGGAGSSTTGQPTLLRSARYLAPEQIQGESVDAKADIYAFGAMIFEMLTGHLPFSGETAVEVGVQHLRTNAPAPSRFNPALSRQVDVAVLKALAKNPSQRFSTATSLVETLALAQPVAAEAGGTTVMPRIGDLKLPPRVASAEPIVMLPEAPHHQRIASYWTALIVAILGFGFVFLAFMAGQDALKHSPLAAAPSFSSVPAPNIRQPASQQAISLVNTATAGGPLALSPFPTTSPTAELSPSPSGTADTATPTPGDTPEPTDTVVQLAATPVPPTAMPAPTVQPTIPPGGVIVPNVVGMAESDAQKTISAAGLTTTFPNYQSYTSQAPGHVLSQTPSAGTLVQRGATVYIAVRK